MLDDLEKKLHTAERHAKNERRRYWRKRRAVIAYLGGGCCICGDFIESHLEIHHTHPKQSSPKGHWRGCRGGAARMRDLDLILAGKLDAKLYCKHHHKEEGHPTGTPMDTTALRDSKKNGECHG